ncbi:uncharacterized [Tachysurus ichikawai]
MLGWIRVNLQVSLSPASPNWATMDFSDNLESTSLSQEHQTKHPTHSVTDCQRREHESDSMKEKGKCLAVRGVPECLAETPMAGLASQDFLQDTDTGMAKEEVLDMIKQGLSYVSEDAHSM